MIDAETVGTLNPLQYFCGNGTASSTERKADSPPACLCFPSSGELRGEQLLFKTDINGQHGQQWHVRVYIKDVPIIEFQLFDGGPRNAYRVEDFLGVDGGRPQPFTVWSNDDLPVAWLTIDPGKRAELSRDILAAIPASAGRFAVAWESSDPSIPF